MHMSLCSRTFVSSQFGLPSRPHKFPFSLPSLLSTWITINTQSKQLLGLAKVASKGREAGMNIDSRSAKKKAPSKGVRWWRKNAGSREVAETIWWSERASKTNLKWILASSQQASRHKASESHILWSLELREIDTLHFSKHRSLDGEDSASHLVKCTVFSSISSSRSPG